MGQRQGKAYQVPVGQGLEGSTAMSHKVSRQGCVVRHAWFRQGVCAASLEVYKCINNKDQCRSLWAQHCSGQLGYVNE